MENPIKMDDLGVPLFSETSVSWNLVFQERPNIRRSPPGWGEPRKKPEVRQVYEVSKQQNTWVFPQNGSQEGYDI